MAAPSVAPAVAIAAVVVMLAWCAPAHANKCDGLVTMSQIVGDSPSSCPTGDGASGGKELSLGLAVLKGFAANTNAVLTGLLDEGDSGASGSSTPDLGEAAEQCKSYLDGDDAAAPRVMEKVTELQKLNAKISLIRQRHEKDEKDFSARVEGFYMKHIRLLSRLNEQGTELANEALGALSESETQCAECASLDETEGVVGAKASFCVPDTKGVGLRLRSMKVVFGYDLFKEVRGHCEECCQASGPTELCMYESNSILKMFGTEDVSYTYDCQCVARTSGRRAPEQCTAEMCSACEYKECYAGPSDVFEDNEALRSALAEHNMKYRVDIGSGFAKFHRKTSVEVTRVPTEGTIRDVIKTLCVRLDMETSDCRFADIYVMEKGSIRRTKLPRDEPALGLMPAYGENIYLQKNIAEMEEEMARQHEREEAQKLEQRRRDEERLAKQRRQLEEAKAKLAEEAARKKEEARIAREKAAEEERQRLAEEERVRQEAAEKERIAKEEAEAKEAQRRQEEDARREAELQAKKAQFRKKCIDAQRRARALTWDSREWFGSPIFCGGECPSGYSPPYREVRRDKYGAGSWYSGCWTGWKVLCERRWSTTDFVPDCEGY